MLNRQNAFHVEIMIPGEVVAIEESPIVNVRYESTENRFVMLSVLENALMPVMPLRECILDLCYAECGQEKYSLIRDFLLCDVSLDFLAGVVLLDIVKGAAGPVELNSD